MESESTVLFESWSPLCDILASVVEEAGTVYFMLYGPRDIIPLGEQSWSGVRPCWICNTNPAQLIAQWQQIHSTMNQGQPPTMPATHCAHAATGLKLNMEALGIIWFEEGDCAALIYEGEIMAVIPAWATPSISEINGYSREFIGEPFLWTLPLKEALPVLEPRVSKAHEFWETWSLPETWSTFSATRIAALESTFGPHSRYFAIDGDSFPLKAVLLFEDEKTYTFVTMGMSIPAQPRVELYTDSPEQLRRIEIGMSIEKAALEGLSIEDMGSFISTISSMPWQQLCWFGPGHTFQSHLFGESSIFKHVLLVDKDLESPPISLPHYQGDLTRLLWMVPITPEECHLLHEQSSEALIKKLSAAHHTYQHEQRISVV